MIVILVSQASRGCKIASVDWLNFLRPLDSSRQKARVPPCHTLHLFRPNQRNIDMILVHLEPNEWCKSGLISRGSDSDLAWKWKCTSVKESLTRFLSSALFRRTQQTPPLVRRTKFPELNMIHSISKITPDFLSSKLANASKYEQMSNGGMKKQNKTDLSATICSV